MSKYKAILRELLGTALNFSDGELSELFTKADEDLTDEEVKALSDKAKTRYRDTVSGINKTAQLEADKKFEAGQRAKAKEFEKALKEQFTIQTDKQGLELIEEIRETALKSTSTKTGKDLTDDDIKKHPAFIKAENEYKKQLDGLKKEKEDSLSQLQADYRKKEVLGEVSKDALQEFDTEGFVFSDDPQRAAAQKELLLEKLSTYEYEVVDGKKIPMKEGKRLENEFGHALELKDLVKTIGSKYFDKKVAQDRKAPNGSDAAGAKDTTKQSTTYTGKMPKSEAEWLQMQEDPRLSLKDKMAVNDFWNKQQQPA